MDQCKLASVLIVINKLIAWEVGNYSEDISATGNWMPALIAHARWRLISHGIEATVIMRVPRADGQ